MNRSRVPQMQRGTRAVVTATGDRAEDWRYAWARPAPRRSSWRSPLLESPAARLESAATRGPRTRAYDPLKRSFDLLFCLAAMPGLLFMMTVIAAAIYLEDRHQPFFFQERTGYRGRRFRMYKFRTMVPHAETLKATLQHLNELDPPDFKIKDDPRITRVGRFLRRTSLDELPQILNILWGDMSLVGPRPTSFGPETYEPWQRRRLDALPGLTGLWQVSGRSDVEFAERARLDIHYVENRSFWLDLRIMWRTVSAVLRKQGAY